MCLEEVLHGQCCIIDLAPQPRDLSCWAANALCVCMCVHVAALCQVPLPVLPMASLGLSAFLADADCRAGMYQVPPVSAGALAAAAADDAAAAAAAAAEAEAAAEAAAVAAAAADSDTSLTDSDSTSDIPPAAGDIAYDYVLMGGKGAAGQQQQHGVSSSAGAGPSYRPGVRPGGVLRRRASPGSAAAAAAEAEAAAAAAKGPARPHLDKWRRYVQLIAAVVSFAKRHAWCCLILTRHELPMLQVLC